MDQTENQKSSWQKDLLRILIVMALGLTLRLWVVAHTEVAARDSIGFIRYALQIETPPEGKTRLEVIREALHPPGYALAVMVVSWPVRSLWPNHLIDSMVLSSQLVSVLSMLLLVLPMYALAKRLWNREVAFIATGIFQVLPVCVQITSDGLSDGLFLFTICTSLWFGVRALQGERIIHFIQLGISSGFAYLVRPEGLMIICGAEVCLLFSLVLRQYSWRLWFRYSGGTILGVLLIAGPYIGMIGKLTNKTTGQDLGRILRGMFQGKEVEPSWKARPEALRNIGHSAIASSPTSVFAPNFVPNSISNSILFAAWWSEWYNKGESRWLWGAKTVANETLKGFHYLVALFAVIGLWLTRRSWFSNSSIRLLLLISAGHSCLLLFMAAKIGYVSERHTLLLVLIGCLFAGYAIPQLAAYGHRWQQRRKQQQSQNLLSPNSNTINLVNPIGSGSASAHFDLIEIDRPIIKRQSSFILALCLLILIVSLPRAIRPLHSNRAGHHAAGHWLAQNAKPEEVIWDPFCWAEFYADRISKFAG